MKSKSALIKFVVLQSFLLIETVLFSTLVNEYVQKQEFFRIDWEFSLKVIGLMILVLYTLSLILVIENIPQSSIFTALVSAAGISLPVFIYDTTYGLIIAILTLLVVFIDNYQVERIREILIKPRPSYLLRKPSKGFLFILSVFAGVLVALQLSGVERYNIGERIAEIVEEPLESIVKQQVNQQISSQQAQISPLLQNFGLSGINLDPDTITSNLNLNIKDVVTKQVNSFIEPYKNFISPLIAIITFGLFQLYAGIAYLIFSITIGIIFSIALKTGFIKKEIIQVEKEKLIL